MNVSCVRAGKISPCWWMPMVCLDETMNHHEQKPYLSLLFFSVSFSACPTDVCVIYSTLSADIRIISTSTKNCFEIKSCKHGGGVRTVHSDVRSFLYKWMVFSFSFISTSLQYFAMQYSPSNQSVPFKNATYFIKHIQKPYDNLDEFK